MKLNNEVTTSKLRTLEKEIPKLTGERRDEAMKVYRDLLFSTSEEAVYFMRS